MTHTPIPNLESLATEFHALPMDARAEFAGGLDFQHLLECARHDLQKRENSLAGLFLCYVGESAATANSRAYVDGLGEDLVYLGALNQNELADLAVVLGNNYSQGTERRAPDLLKMLQMRILAARSSTAEHVLPRFEQLSSDLSFLAPDVFRELRDAQRVTALAKASKANDGIAKLTNILLNLAESPINPKCLNVAASLTAEVLGAQNVLDGALLSKFGQVIQEFILTTYYDRIPKRELFEVGMQWEASIKMPDANSPMILASMAEVWGFATSGTGFNYSNLLKSIGSSDKLPYTWSQFASLGRALHRHGDDYRDHEELTLAAALLCRARDALPKHRLHFEDGLFFAQGLCLESIYQITSSIPALDAAINILNRVSNPRLQDRTAELLNYLHHERYSRTRYSGDLDELMGRPAYVESSSEDNVRLRINDAAIAVTIAKGHDPEALRRAILQLRAVLKEEPDTEISKIASTNLIQASLALAETSPHAVDLDEALQQAAQLVDETPLDDPWRSRRIMTANEILVLMARNGQPFDSARYVSLLEESLKQSAGPPWSRARCAFRGANILHEFNAEREATLRSCRVFGEAYQEALRATLDSMELSQMIEQLGPAVGQLAALALDLACPDTALYVLATGINAVWRHRFDVSLTIDQVNKFDPELARRLGTSHHDLLELDREQARGEPEGSLFTTSMLKRASAEREWKEALNEVRRLPGNETFLRTPDLRELEEASRGQAFLILMVGFDYGCALLVQDGQSRIRKSKLLSGTYLAGLARDFENCFRKDDDSRFDLLMADLGILANEISELVIAPAGTDIIELKTLRTGPLAKIPIHLALSLLRSGHGGCVGGTPRLHMSYVFDISSFITPQVQKFSSSARIAFVGMQETPGYADLPGVLQELSAITSVLPTREILYSGRPGASLSEGRWGPATVSNFMSSLTRCSILHYAGHGFAPKVCKDGVQPGGIVLSDGLITTRDFVDPGAASWQLAYLSGCETGYESAMFMDQAVTLCQSMLRAGFETVVGAITEVEDEVAFQVARAFYERWASKANFESPAMILGEAVVSLLNLTALQRAPFVCFHR